MCLTNSSDQTRLAFACLLADEDHLQVAARRGGGDPPEQLHLLGVPGQGDHAIDLVEHHAQLLGLETAGDQDRRVLGRQLVGRGQGPGERERPIEQRHGPRRRHLRSGNERPDNAP